MHVGGWSEEATRTNKPGWVESNGGEQLFQTDAQALLRWAQAGREAGREKATEQPVGRGPGRANPRTLRWEDTWEIRKGGGNCRDYGLRRRTEERAVGDNERNAFRGQILYAALESGFFLHSILSEIGSHGGGYFSFFCTMQLSSHKSMEER